MCLIHTYLFRKDLFREPLPGPYTLLQTIPDTLSLRRIAAREKAKYFLFYFGQTPVSFCPHALDRLLQVAEMSGAGLIYSDYYKTKTETASPHPTLDYQEGSLRDDFDFGPLVLYKASAFRQAVAQMETPYQYAALYDLRLKISQFDSLFHLPELLYSVEEEDNRTSGEKQFDYVDPRNREVQLEMEQVCTAHLKAIGAWLPPPAPFVDSYTEKFPVEASIIIPVKNRVKTIADAVHSALEQHTDFPFNVIVINNHSNDGTTEILNRLAGQHRRLIHSIPDSTCLGIGGCWDAALRLPDCGKFAVQLDSDDLYNSPQSLQTIVQAFYEQHCVMVVGSYQMVNFQLEEIPPGVIDHREWTWENGHNNALRVNGFGAPRAFYTPILRKIGFPNVSYGEDYAVGLALSREYPIGRIFSPLYLCRRWAENSDAALDISRLNHYNFYKDKIRSLEIAARKQYRLTHS